MLVVFACLGPRHFLLVSPGALLSSLGIVAFKEIGSIMAFFYPTMGARPCYLGDGAHDSCW